MKTNVQNVPLTEVPNYQILRDQVKLKISEHKIQSTPNEKKSWNEKFHHIIGLCNLKSEYEMRDLPASYAKGSICGHVFQIK